MSYVNVANSMTQEFKANSQIQIEEAQQRAEEAISQCRSQIIIRAQANITNVKTQAEHAVSQAQYARDHAQLVAQQAMHEAAQMAQRARQHEQFVEEQARLKTQQKEEHITNEARAHIVRW